MEVLSFLEAVKEGRGYNSEYPEHGFIPDISCSNCIYCYPGYYCEGCLATPGDREKEMDFFYCIIDHPQGMTEKKECSIFQHHDYCGRGVFFKNKKNIPEFLRRFPTNKLEELVFCLSGVDVTAKVIERVDGVEGMPAYKVEYDGIRYIVVLKNNGWKRYLKLHKSDPRY